jgi:hypothetical protein
MGKATRLSMFDHYTRLSPSEQAQVRHELDAFTRTLDAPNDMAEEFCTTVSRWLTRSVPTVDLPAMELPDFAQLQPSRAQEVYWREIDETVTWTRTALFAAVSECLADIVGLPRTSLVLRMFRLRQLLELVSRGCTYQYGLTCSWNLLRESLPKLSGKLVFAKELEDFVRGEVSVSPGRWASLHAARDVDIPALPPTQVAESDPSGAKTFSILRFVANVLAELGRPSLRADCDRMEHAYDAACALTHVTPLFLGSIRGGFIDPRQLQQVSGEIVVMASLSALRVAEETIFSDEFAVIRFAHLFPRQADCQAVVMVEIPELAAIRTANNQVAFKATDGRVIPVYDGKRRRK